MSRNHVKNVLDRGILDENSGIFLSKNIKKIQKFLFLKGFGDVTLGDIKKYLANSRSYNHVVKNFSRRKISETSKGYDGQQAFFHTVHCDVAVLSKKRRYGVGGNPNQVMVFVDQLSNYVYLERLTSTSSKHSMECFLRVFSHSPYLPQLCKWFIFDNGIEYRSNAMKDFFASYGIKANFVRLQREERSSRGSAIAERQIRRFRRFLESVVAEFKSLKFIEVLEKVEDSMNSASQSSLASISSRDALKHDARYISMLKHSARFRRRKFLKREMASTRHHLYSVVRVIKSVDKLPFEKEAYQAFSLNMYITIEVDSVDFVTRYRLGNLFDLKPVTESFFAHHELKFLDISWPNACYLQSIRTAGPAVGHEGDLIVFQPETSPKQYCAPKEVFDVLN